MKKLISLLIASLILSACSLTPSNPESKQLKVVVSFYVLEDFTKKIGGDAVEVVNLLPGSMEPHDYELSTTDMITLSDASLIFILGNDFEPWYKDFESSLDPSRQSVSIISKGIDTITLESTGQVDPHIWTSLRNARQMLKNIRDALVKANPDNMDLYDANLAKYDEEFANLDQTIREELSDRTLDVFVSNHAAFGYFAADYGLTMIPVLGLEPDAEPDAAQMQRIIELVKTYQIPVILYEDVTDTKVAETIADETGAKTGLLRTLESLSEEERAKGEDYLSLMRQNLESLKKALNP